MKCEMCGNEGGKLRRITIEGSILSVCPNCERFGQSAPGKSSPGEGHTVVEDRLDQRSRRMRSKDVYQQISLELVVDYPKVIKEARKGMGMTPEDLGKKLNEKRSVISKLEHGELRPDNDLIQKLERALDITLKEEVKEVHVEKRAFSTGMTLGDFIKVEKQ